MKTGQTLSSYLASGAVYALVGGAAALAEWAVFLAATDLGELHYAGAALGAFVVATAVNFALSRRIGFRSRGLPLWLEAAAVYAVSAGALAVNMAVLVMLVEGFDAAPFPAKAAGTGAAFFVNFAVRQFVVFDRRPRWSWATLIAGGRQ